MYSAKIRVYYHLEKGTIVLRTEKDWNEDIYPVDVNEKEHYYEFHLKHDKYYLNAKPCIRDGSEVIWAQGDNRQIVFDLKTVINNYPYFYSEPVGKITDVIEFYSHVYNKKRLFRIYLPAGYNENQMKKYPILYMHDGSNLFFPEEAFGGSEWQVDETLHLLDSMNIIDQMIVVGVYAADRNNEYTKPGYEDYGKFMVNELKPWIDANLRTLTTPWYTSIMGSSLGGVVSFYLAWEYPHIFGSAACFSSTFSWRDDLIERVETDSFEERKNSKFYIDTGWPGDNYEVGFKMASTLVSRGFRHGRDFLYLVFPMAKHNEADWASRLHIPIQLFAGKLRTLNMKFHVPEAKIY